MTAKKKEKRHYSLPRFTRDPVAVKLIRKIVTRAIGLYGPEVTLDRLSTEMDLSATHANGCPLNFDRLLAFDDFSFMHDITGIYRHLDRETGKLVDFFRPRCAVPAPARSAIVRRADEKLDRGA